MSEENASDKEKYARLLYTRMDWSLRDIALEVDVEEAQLRQWSRQHAWDGMKMSLVTSRRSQLQMLYRQLSFINSRCGDEPSAKDADLVLKYTRAIRDLEEEPSVSEVIETFEVFILWMRRREPALTKQLIGHFDAFVKLKLES